MFLLLNHFENCQIKIIGDIFLSNFHNVKGPSGYLALSGSNVTRLWRYRQLICIISHYTIDFSINGLSTENHFRSQRTRTPFKIKANNCKFIDLEIRIELTRAILMPWFPNFQRNLTTHFRMFLYLETCFLRVTVSLLYCIKDTFSNLSLSN